MTLLEIVKEHSELVSLFSDPEVDEQIINDTLEGVKAELEIKAESYINVLDFLGAETKHLDEIIKAATDKKSVIENNIKRIKDTMVYALIETGHDKDGLVVGEHTLKVQGNGGKQPLKITGEVPDSFKKIVLENDNDKIRAYLKDNELSWAHLEPRGKHLAIK